MSRGTSSTGRARPADFEARERIVAARGRSLTVEAGAGTGKTTLLVERVVERVRGGALLERLAIITFTRKAAAELKGRLRAAFAAHAGEEAFAVALAGFEHAPIGTTDSFCRRILSDVALEAGVPPDFGLAEEIASAAMRDEAWSRLLARATPAHEDSVRRLRAAGIDLAALRAAAEDALDSRDLALPEIPAPPPASERPALLPALRAAGDAALAFLPLCRNPEDALARRIRDADALLRQAESLGAALGESALLLRVAKSSFGSKRDGRKEAWGGAGGKEDASRALTRLDEIVAEHVAARGAALLADAFRWCEDFRAEYEAVKRERGVLDFRDLALHTRDLLRRDARLRARLASQFDEILLDEVQDSDPLQMEIAFLLAASSANPEDPLASRVAPGKLVLIGDPKQSIYRFRRADIELYERARARLRGDGGDETIQVNFRSHEAILAFVNRLFAGWMEPQDGRTYQARAVDLQPGRAKPPEEGPRVHVILPDEALRRTLLERRALPRENTALLDDVETDALARTVRRILGRDGAAPWTVHDRDTGEPRPARPADVAVLVRRAVRGDALLDTLESLEIPANVAGGKRFYAREEIATLAAVVRTIADPEDEFLRFAALRSGAFGFDDDTLVLARLDALPPDHPNAPALAAALETLERLEAIARTMPVAEFLPILVEELSLRLVVGSRIGGRARAGSLAMLVEGASALEDAGLDSLPDFADWLTVQESEERAEPPGELELEDDAVQILTMHKSKGLEFPVVILADLTKGGGEHGRSAIVVPRRAEGTIALRLGAKAACVETPDFERALEEEREREDAEAVRLLYVATTRAREHLLFSWMPKAPRSRTERFLEEPALVREIGAKAGEAPEPGGTIGIVRAGELAAIEVRRTEPERDAAPHPPLHAARDWIDSGRRGARVLRASGGADPEARVEGAAAPGAPAVAAHSPGAHTAAVRLASPFAGAPFGTLVHKALELVRPAPDAAQSAARALDEAIRALRAGSASEARDWALSLAAADCAALSRFLERLLRDPAVAAIPKAPRVEREVPFLLPIGGDFLSGTLDVLVEGRDGSLSIVDYKTDRAVPSGGAASLSARYREQALLSAFALAAITKRRVREFRFLFVAADPVVVVSFEIDDDAIAQARSVIARRRREFDGSDESDESGVALGASDSAD